ncbi:retrovirus-related pol polyprotein from transposon TNT 1-94 [Tanacetum coccineum]
MSTSKTYQQSLADAGSETRPPMLERGSYIPWASRFRRYLNQKRDNRKWLLKALDEGPYEFKNFNLKIYNLWMLALRARICGNEVERDLGEYSKKNSSNTEEITDELMFKRKVVEGMNAPNETGNVQRTLRTSSSGNTSTIQCYNCSGKGYYSRNCPKPRVRDSKYFMEQMLLAKQDEAGVILTDEQNDFLFADASKEWKKILMNSMKTYAYGLILTS